MNRVTVPVAISSGCFGEAPVTLHLTMTEKQAVYLLEVLTAKVKEAHETEKPAWRKLSDNMVHTLAMSLGEEKSPERSQRVHDGSAQTERA